MTTSYTTLSASSNCSLKCWCGYYTTDYDDWISHSETHRVKRSPVDKTPLRHPVDYLYNKLNPDFLKAMAMIAAYADTKYGSAEQYTEARLVGEKSPINHIYEHLRQYQIGEVHDRFGSVEMQLASIAYNASMEWFYCKKFGHVKNPIVEAM